MICSITMFSYTKKTSRDIHEIFEITFFCENNVKTALFDIQRNPSSQTFGRQQLLNKTESDRPKCISRQRKKSRGTHALPRDHRKFPRTRSHGDDAEGETEWWARGVYWGNSRHTPFDTGGHRKGTRLGGRIWCRKYGVPKGGTRLTFVGITLPNDSNNVFINKN